MEVDEGREDGTISVEMDRLIGTADEAGLSVGPLTPEENRCTYKLLARPTKAMFQESQTRLTAKGAEEVVS